MAIDPPNRIELPLSWVCLDEHPVLLANQFLIQMGGREEFVLSLGQLVPPPLVGTPDEQAEQASEISFVPVRPLARVNLTRTRLVELIQILQIQLERHDTAMRGMDPTEGGGM